LKGVDPSRLVFITGSNIKIEVWPPLYLVVLTVLADVPSIAYFSLGNTY